MRRFSDWLLSEGMLDNLVAGAWKDPTAWLALADEIEEGGEDGGIFRRNPAFRHVYRVFHAPDDRPSRVLPELEKSTANGGFGEMVSEGNLSFPEFVRLLWDSRWYSWHMEANANEILLRTVPERQHGFWGWSTFVFTPVVALTAYQIKIIKDIMERAAHLNL